MQLNGIIICPYIYEKLIRNILIYLSGTSKIAYQLNLHFMLKKANKLTLLLIHEVKNILLTSAISRRGKDREIEKIRQNCGCCSIK